MANKASCAVPLTTGTSVAENVAGVLHTPAAKTNATSEGLKSRMSAPYEPARDSRLRLTQAGDGVDGEVFVVDVLPLRVPATLVAAGHFFGLYEATHAIGLHVVTHHADPGPHWMTGFVLDRHLVVGVLRVVRFEGLPDLTAAVVGVVGHVHAVAHVDPGALLAHRRARIADRLRLDHDGFRHQFHPHVVKGLALGTAVHGSLPVGVVAAHEVPTADDAEHRFTTDDLVVAPGQHGIARRPGVR